MEEHAVPARVLAEAYRNAWLSREALDAREEELEGKEAELQRRIRRVQELRNQVRTNQSAPTAASEQDATSSNSVEAALAKARLVAPAPSADKKKRDSSSSRVRASSKVLTKDAELLTRAQQEVATLEQPVETRTERASRAFLEQARAALSDGKDDRRRRFESIALTLGAERGLRLCTRLLSQKLPELCRRVRERAMGEEDVFQACYWLGSLLNLFRDCLQFTESIGTPRPERAQEHLDRLLAQASVYPYLRSIIPRGVSMACDGLWMPEVLIAPRNGKRFLEVAKDHLGGQEAVKACKEAAEQREGDCQKQIGDGWPAIQRHLLDLHVDLLLLREMEQRWRPMKETRTTPNDRVRDCRFASRLLHAGTRGGSLTFSLRSSHDG